MYFATTRTKPLSERMFVILFYLCYNLYMKSTLTSPTVDQLRVRGQYETVATDTRILAAELSSPRDLDQLTSDFDNGYTPLRDVGGMLTAQRDAILDAYQRGGIGNLLISHPDLLAGPVINLHARVTRREQDQPVGHNFFVNATGFLDARLPWAIQLDHLMRTRTGHDIYNIAQSKDKAGKDRLLAAMTESPDGQMTETLGVYLAGRSLEGESYLEHHYGNEMQHAKADTCATIQKIGRTTGLSAVTLNRVAGQLHRAAFGSFDHLEGLVTADNTGTDGDYRIGSLRIEVKFDGSVRFAQLRDSAEARRIISHELGHAGSAQEDLRCGLQVNGLGLEPNEGMAEYISQLALGEPGIERLPDCSSLISRGVPYRAPVFAQLALHEQFKAGKNLHFAILFNTFCGDAQNPAQLEQALDAFYELDQAISQRLRN